MSKLRDRTKEARELEVRAERLGYRAERTAMGHLRFTHRQTGAIVITPSKMGGRLQKNAHAELRRGAQHPPRRAPCPASTSPSDTPKSPSTSC